MILNESVGVLKARNVVISVEDIYFWYNSLACNLKKFLEITFIDFNKSYCIIFTPEERDSFSPNYFTFFKAEEIRWSSGILLEEEFAVYCIFQRWGNINFIKWVFSKVCQIKREESQEMNGIPWTWNISVLSINFSSYVVHTMLQLASSTEITQVPKWIAQKGT